MVIIVSEQPAASVDLLQHNRIICRITTYSVVSREALTHLWVLWKHVHDTKIFLVFMTDTFAYHTSI
jgi:hypothetical protein